MLKVMHSTAKSTIAKSPWEDLSQIPAPNTIQWENIKTQLDLVLIALESLTGIGSEAMLSAAVNLNLESKVPDRVALWRLRQSNPLRKSQGGRKKLDVEEARSLVLIICHLAKQHQEIIRRAVGLLEQMTANKQKPHQTALLGDYIDTFCNTYQERMEEEEKTSTDLLTHLALKLLINLLFYSASGGHRRLWLALIDPATK
jgi:DNA-binding ferritin-like protein (Dps family)